MMAIDNSIIGNHVYGGKQINVINQTFQILDITPLIESFSKTKVNPSAYIEGPEAQKFFYSIVKDMHSLSPQTAQVPSTDYCFVRDFQETSFFGHDLESCRHDVPDPAYNQSMMEMLEPRDLQELSEWKGCDSSSSLLLYLDCPTGERSEWTTNFTLELIGCIVRLDNHIGPRRPSAVVARFFSKRLDKSQWTQESILRDFLAQIHKARHADLIASHTCKAHEDVTHDFHKVAKRPGDLWNLLKCSAAEAGVETLYIFLDNFDFLHEQADENVLRSFYHNIEMFLRDSQQNNVVVKLLITSRSSDIVPYFSRDSHRIMLSQAPEERFRN